MRIFACPNCGQIIYFDNFACYRCDTEVAYSRERGDMVPIVDGAFRDGFVEWRRCQNAVAGCNWVVRADSDQTQCFSCALTRERPVEGGPELVRYLRETTHAKRWLLFQLDELGLPIVSHTERREGGLAFDLDASTDDNRVMIGHLNGVITIDLTEAKDSHREALRVMLNETYRTMLGHFRHEIGHYFWQALVQPDASLLAGFRAVFGDERRDYGAALDAHYSSAGAVDWRASFISQYATTHPWEDFAETFAHYLHITDTLESAAAFGLRMDGPAGEWTGVAARLAAEPSLAVVDGVSMATILGEWQPLALALNQTNRSMGKGDLYPFVIPGPVATKLGWVHDFVAAARIRRPGRA